jgi:peptidoglycan/LPS O-acetylase OafA/YrhL
MLNSGGEFSAAVRWLRVSYLAGAAFDALIGMLMLLPSRMGEEVFRYPMGLAASLMFGWVALLLWANNRPMERKGVLIITIFPVISGLVGTGFWAVQVGLFPLQKIVPSTILGVVLICLMAFSYWRAKVVEKRSVT